MQSVQEAFDKYLVICDVPKYRFPIEEAIEFIHNTSGIAILAHPNDPHGTSLAKISKNVSQQCELISKYLIDMGLDGIECWHSRHTLDVSLEYRRYAKSNNLLISAGTDCHQNPINMGNLDIPEEYQKELLMFHF